MTILKVRPGEERVSLLLVGLMLFTAAGAAIGGSATEALFFARFGVDLLPLLYIGLGLFSFATSLAITAVMGRVAKQRLYVALPFLLGFLLILERLVVLLNLRWFFAVMWLVMNVIGSLQGLLTWGLAGMACDTRQAKRLFPLFSAGGILGTVLGGLVTPFLAGWLHTENLLLVWAGAMFISHLLGRVLVRHVPAGLAGDQASRPRVVEEVQRGFRFVRRSPIMQWVSYSAILFSVCYFSLALPFSRGAAARYADADQLAGFLGVFQSLYTGAALVLSLFMANRLFARFGILRMLLVFPIIYLAGFAMLAITSAAIPGMSISAAFALLVAFRFAQMAYMNGIAAASWQAMFNVVPTEQRDQVRAFVSGVPEQAGTFLAGLILFIGEQTLQARQLYLVGLASAALTTYLIWRASRSYSQALVDALRAGQPQVFFNDNLAPGNPSTPPAGVEAGAIPVLIGGLRDSDPRVRRVAVEIISQVPVPEASRALMAALADNDPQVRAAALKGLALAGAAPALLDVAACLSDPDPEVRFQAIDTFRQLAPYPRGIQVHLEPFLADPAPAVRAQAAQALLCITVHSRARELLHSMLSDSDPSVRILALDAVGRCQDGAAFERVVPALVDAQPGVRRAAARALAALDPRAALPHLLQGLADPDRSVRAALAETLGRVGEEALDPLVAALADPACEEGALQALGYLPARQAEQKLRAYAGATARAALHYHNLALGLACSFENLAAGNGPLQLLCDSLVDQARRCGLNALRALGLLTPGDRAAIAVENLQSPSAIQRANALETLETIGERQTIRPLLAIWETGEAVGYSLPEGWLASLLDDSNAWLRACAVQAASQFLPDSALEKKLGSIRCDDPDETVRFTAERVLSGDMQMETLPTLSLIERTLFLRRVPLFNDLQPGDLKQVAAIACEILFDDHQTLVNQGEVGNEMYIIISGEVRVLVTPSKQPEPHEIARRGVGDYVGEMAVINQEPRMATLIADGPVRVLCIRQQHFEHILRERPEISLAMLRSLSNRLREASLAIP